MTEEDNKLLEQFFAANPIKVEDNGFTEKVLRHLQKPAPSHAWCLARIWTAVGIIAGIAFFIAIKGWNILFQALVSIDLSAFSTIDFNLHNILIYVVGIATLLLVGAYNLVTNAK